MDIFQLVLLCQSALPITGRLKPAGRKLATPGGYFYYLSFRLAKAKRAGTNKWAVRLDSLQKNQVSNFSIYYSKIIKFMNKNCLEYNYTQTVRDGEGWIG